MNNLPGQKIKEIFTQYSHSVYYDPKLCQALLKVFCGQYRKEISVLKLNCPLQPLPIFCLSRNTSLTSIKIGKSNDKTTSVQRLFKTNLP